MESFTAHEKFSSGGWWQTKSSVSPGPGLWSLVLGPFGPDLGPDLDLTSDLDLDLSLKIKVAIGYMFIYCLLKVLFDFTHRLDWQSCKLWDFGLG